MESEVATQVGITTQTRWQHRGGPELIIVSLTVDGVLIRNSAFALGLLDAPGLSYSAFPCTECFLECFYSHVKRKLVLVSSSQLCLGMG